MVHHGVQSVVETSILVEQEYRLDSTVPAVSIQILELKHTDVVDLTHVDLLIGEVFATRVSATDSLIIRNNDEVSRS